MRCVSYTRTVSNRPLSSGVQTESIMSQNQRIQDFAKARGWKIEKKYSDRKKNADEETAFLEMKADGIARKFDCVIIDSMFLCGKRVMLAVDLFNNVFLPGGIVFAVVEDGIVSSDLTSEDVSGYLEGCRNEYGELIRKAALNRYSEKRQYPKYGYRYIGDTMELVVDEKVAPVVRKIFQLAGEGNSAEKISEILNCRGIENPYSYWERTGLPGSWHSRTDGNWDTAGVKRILGNRLYIGEWERTVGGNKIMVPCPAIIDNNLFQEVEEKRIKRKRKTFSQTAFAAMMVDRDTGGRIGIYTQRSSQEKIYRMVYPKPLAADYEKMWIRYSDVEDQVMKQLRVESEKVKTALRLLESETGRKEKERRCQEVQKKVREVFDEMVLLEWQNCMDKNYNSACGDILGLSSVMADDAREKIFAVERELKEAETRTAEIEKIFSKQNPWIKLYAGMELPDELTGKFVKRYIERIECVRFEYVEVQFKEQQWLRALPGEWFKEESL